MKKIFQNVNQIQLYYINKIINNGQEIKVRDRITKELCGVDFCLKNPLNRETSLKKRRWSLSLAIHELLWHLKGSDSLKEISSSNKNWLFFSDNDQIIKGSSYGKKIFETESGLSLWDQVKRTIASDINTRRAVISLFDNQDLINTESKDISCVNNMQFLFRNGKLDLYVNMRSNDIIWGLPYDIFLFTFLHEIMSIELKLPIGKYYHSTTSLHIYEHHYDLGQEILSYNNEDDDYKTLLPSLTNPNIRMHLTENIDLSVPSRTNALQDFLIGKMNV